MIGAFIPEHNSLVLRCQQELLFFEFLDSFTSKQKVSNIKAVNFYFKHNRLLTTQTGYIHGVSLRKYFQGSKDLERLYHFLVMILSF